MEKEIKLEAKIPKEPMILSSKKKWFWIGIIIATMNWVAGLVYGIALLREKDYKKEAWKIIFWSIVRAMIAYIIYIWLLKRGVVIPREQFYLPKSPILPIAQ